MWNLTQKALAQSLKDLLQTRSLDDITIADITGKCGVSRQTFYYHFKDINDLLKWIFINEAREEIGNRKTIGTWQQGLLNIFLYCRSNRAMITAAFHSELHENLEVFLCDCTFTLLYGVVEEEAKGLEVPEKRKRFIADFFKYSFVGVLMQWIEDGMVGDPHQIVSQIGILMEGDFAKALRS